ncbi:Protein phosphatase inhibitor [Aphelenchoides besseyi]|nr:Protein phosphatase inhibitor [Aphelenchoides besseyi]KAI6227173.1 Protein phosphatase inhibitor [Aphelenchoides besseyi]
MSVTHTVPDVGTQTVVAANEPATSGSSNTQTEHLVLHLRNSNRPRVTFTADTVDNENLGRMKSKCCCIYSKPRQWDDPSTWEQDEAETEHCRGHCDQPHPAPSSEPPKDNPPNES